MSFTGTIGLPGTASFGVKVYDPDLDLVGQKVLMASGEPGTTTDLQAATDGENIYVAYELLKGTGAEGEHRVYIVKYDGNLNAVKGPENVLTVPNRGIAGEHSDDPSPFLQGDYLYLETHFGENAATDKSFRLRRFNKDLEPLDIGSLPYVDLYTGRGRTTHSVASEVFVGGDLYLVTQVTTTEQHPDILVFRYDSDFRFDGFEKALHAEKGLPEMRPVGFLFEGGKFYLAYSEFKFDNGLSEGGVVYLDIYDRELNLLQEVEVSDEKQYADHSTVAVAGDRVYVAYWQATGPDVLNRNVFVREYEWK